MRYLTLFFLFISTSVFASGGGGYGGGFSGSGVNSRSVDRLYEAGKSIAKGRNKTYGKLKICVVDTQTEELEKVKIKSKTMKPYKGKTLVELANNLYDCENPEQPIFKVLSRDDMNLVLYYLNKRYKLKLSS